MLRNWIRNTITYEHVRGWKSIKDAGQKAKHRGNNSCIANINLVYFSGIDLLFSHTSWVMAALIFFYFPERWNSVHNANNLTPSPARSGGGMAAFPAFSGRSGDGLAAFPAFSARSVDGMAAFPAFPAWSGDGLAVFLHSQLGRVTAWPLSFHSPLGWVMDWQVFLTFTRPHSFASPARSHARHEHETEPKPISRFEVSCVDQSPSISDI